MSKFDQKFSRNNVKEKLFISLAWLPKATVQAALGPVALGKAREALAKYISAQVNTDNCLALVLIQSPNPGMSMSMFHYPTKLGSLYFTIQWSKRVQFSHLIPCTVWIKSNI